MIRIKPLFASFIALLLLLSIVTAAADSSTGVLIEKKSANNKIDKEITRAKITKECEEKPTIPARIACRLKNKDNLQDTVPEPCRVLDVTNKGGCISYFARMQRCYNETGQKKDACFKEVAGFKKKKISREEARENKQAHKDYLLALLYDLQEKAEKQVERGKISAEDGAEIVAKILEIKVAVQEGKPKKDIKAMLEELKKLWKEKIKNEN